MVAAAQTGRHNDKRISYGHAMIVDPWGAVVAQCSDGEIAYCSGVLIDASTRSFAGTGMCIAEVDADLIGNVRSRQPVSQHRRSDLYFVLAAADFDNAQVLPNETDPMMFAEKRIDRRSVFYETALTFAFVNRNPLVQGRMCQILIRYLPMVFWCFFRRAAVSEARVSAIIGFIGCRDC